MSNKYVTQPYPWKSPARLDGLPELKRAFNHLMQSREERIQTIRAYFIRKHEYDIAIDADDATLDQLPIVIAKCGGLVPRPRMTFDESDPASKRARVLWQLQSPWYLDDQTMNLVLDGALLWGEVYRHRYPASNWVLCKSPRTGVDFGEPCLSGPNPSAELFSPRGYLLRFVFASLTDDSTEKWCPSLITGIRAFYHGFIPDPRLDPVWPGPRFPS